jgi:hypothetical protein
MIKGTNEFVPTPHRCVDMEKKLGASPSLNHMIRNSYLAIVRWSEDYPSDLSFIVQRRTSSCATSGQ